MTPAEIFRLYLDACPLIAILRGVTPDEVEPIGQALFDAGIRIIEIPVQSSEALPGVERLVAHFGNDALIGAGTVLTEQVIAPVAAAGGRLIISPAFDPSVVSATVAAGLISCPGYFTPSEAVAALKGGAHALKFFPAEGGSPAVLKAQRVILPKKVPLIVVGGITPGDMAQWLDAGADGFGLGSALYKPGQSAAETGEKARAFIEALPA
ncbi:2-dehydro-3-deoxy-6-phosphogalactonate aldolase [Sphingomonas lutea]|uniref:2-dehydro-3-deoxy-6-phosphogalactonate aldolase n=1 Tax=Sphingomonas lutea TaxID=1045317 RepID=A0A7G9SIU9_9SPHN|nr:2-dehydro-3-deoxy-6-phosphogalactonate aldolase [Sphingomonas lutea]QNN67774.1 2-dehydro-3-deoxy-6-phosphogalactonate aldolase [Sphingomonas lutea]